MLAQSHSGLGAAPQARRHRWYAWREDVVLQQQVLLMQGNFNMTLAASLAAALGAVWILYTVVEHDALGWWLLSHLLVVFGIYSTVRWQLPVARSVRHSAWILLLCMAAMGASWASMAWVAVQFGQSEAMLYLPAIIGGVTSGALGLGAPLLPAFLAFLAIPVLVVALGFAYLGGPVFVPLVVMALVYFALTSAQARIAEQATYRSILLQLENTDLVQRLRKESEQSQQALQLAEIAQNHAEIAQTMAETANTDKSKFLAAASHDLRQPLHAMGLFLEALSRGELNGKQRTVLGHAHSAASAASQMLTTLLDFSRLEAGVVKSQPRPFLLQPLLAKLEQEFGLQADEKNLFYRSRDTTLAVFADPTLTDLVLRNLISNAIRYTDQGGLLVCCRKRDTQVALEIWDTGMGIVPEQQTEVFKEFYQLGNPERDRRKGLGLGLAIVQRLSQAMGAKVDLVSEPGRGSVFRLWLDCYQGTIVHDRINTQNSDGLQGMRMIVIDDEEPVRVGMEQLLTSWGCICHTAESLSAALHIVALLPMDAQPQVILADYRLREGATGGQAISALRAYLMLRGHEAFMPAIIITGDTAPERIREAHQTEAMLLHKPVSAHALQQALIQLR